MNDQNLALWDRVWQTDPSHTKPVSEGGRTYTSINATYMVRQATEQWGPLGLNWGYEIIDERFDEGAPILNKEGALLGTTLMHTLRLKLWFIHEGKTGQVEHFGHTPFVFPVSYGLKTDMDAPKKSLTDALKKCLSMLGFSADIFLGLYDLPEYIEERKVEEGIKQADNQDDAAAQARDEFNAFIAQQLRGYGMVPNKAALRTFHDSTVKKAKRRATTLNINPEQVEQRLEARYQERRAELSAGDCEGCKSQGTVIEGVCRNCGQEKTPADTGAN